MKRTLYTVAAYAPPVRPEEVAYRVEIGEDAGDLELLNLAVAEMLVCLGGELIEVRIEGSILVAVCLRPLGKERMGVFGSSLEESGYTPLNFTPPRSDKAQKVIAAYGAGTHRAAYLGGFQ